MVAELWSLIEHARTRGLVLQDADAVGARLVEKLAAMPAEEIVSADEQLRTLAARAYSLELRGAAYVINGGCSDDGFEYFRGWLIAQGERVYNDALVDPDSLAGLFSEGQHVEAESEAMLGATWEAYRIRADSDLPRGASVTEPELGEVWDFEDRREMASRYPKLIALLHNE